MKMPITLSEREGALHAIHESIATSGRSGSVLPCEEEAAALFLQVQSQGLHSGSTLRAPGIEALLQDHLPRHSPDRSGLVRPPARLGSGRVFRSPLDDSGEGGEAAPKKRAFERLEQGILERAQRLGLIDAKPEGAVDSTGFEDHHASRHYLTHRPTSRSFRANYWPKLTVLCHTRSYLWLAAEVARGPGYDCPHLIPVVAQGSAELVWDRILADAGYDSESNHRVCRESLGVRSTVIPVNSRGHRRWPKGVYRRQMRCRFPRRVYGHRAHAEGSFSQHKRHLGSALRNRTESSRAIECLFRVLTHNVMILALLLVELFY